MQSESNRVPRRKSEQGIALVVTILVLSLMAVLMAGFVTLIVTDQRSGGLNQDQTQVYAAAIAGLEKLTSDLAKLFEADYSPSAAQVRAVAADVPVLTDPPIRFLAPDNTTGYTVDFFPDAQGNPSSPDLAGTMITAGPYQGLRGIITPYTLTVTARLGGGAESRIRRTLQTVGIPVFQFGIFSETDLSYFAGDLFNFGGRVHTNQTLYLAAGSGATVNLSDRVTAVREVIRTELQNGWSTSGGYDGTVNVPTSASVVRSLARSEGSFVPGTGTGTGLNTAWTALSVGTYAGYIRNGLTGAQKLDLPLVSQRAAPIDLIRRPLQKSNENTTAPLVFEQRFFSKASLRIVLSDSAAEITDLPGMASGAPVFLGSGKAYAPLGVALLTANLAVSAGPYSDDYLPANVYLSDAGQPMLNGWIKIDMQRQNGTWLDVTSEILSLGISGRNLANTAGTNIAGRWNTAGNTCAEPNPNAIVRLQRVRDVPRDYQPCGISPATGTATAISQRGTDYWPNTLYDAREGQPRDSMATNSPDLSLSGVIQYVEFDVNNLRRWLLGQIGSSGTTARNDNGFIVYFSDRRNNKTLVSGGVETGEFGWEDAINPQSNVGAPNNVLDVGEDLDGSKSLQIYGRGSRNIPAGPLAGNLSVAVVTDPLSTASAAFGVPQAFFARANRTLFFRRALKIVNGGLGNLPSPGLTIASENPVYLQGNYNATSASVAADPHVAAAIIADTVTLLSNNWNDVRSFTNPADHGQRPAATTGYRMAVVAGKGLGFFRSSQEDVDFGTDGGVHNFMRLLENWTGVVERYRGSLVSLYINRQAVGTFKCCTNVYFPPSRDWSFDTDFLTPSLLPPGTPMFRDINTLTFRQLLRPNQ